MDVYDAVLSRRSIRRFRSYKILEKCVNGARLAPSGGNLQPLEFIIVLDEALCNEVFKTLKWAMHLGKDGAPPAGQKPKGYIVVPVNQKIKPSTFEYDVGLAVENILLIAQEEGLGSCCIGSVDKRKLEKILNIPATQSIELVVALGYPAESPVPEEYTGSIKYWRDKKGVHHAPKRNLQDIISIDKFGIT